MVTDGMWVGLYGRGNGAKFNIWECNIKAEQEDQHCKTAGITPTRPYRRVWGSPTFEGSEANRKITYDQRLADMVHKRWARKVYLNIESTNTRWTLRRTKLRSKYLYEGWN